MAGNYTNNYTFISGTSSNATIPQQIGNGQFLVSEPSRTVGERIELPVSDVFNIVKVVDSGDVNRRVSNTMMIATANNISDSYTLDTGQTDNIYGHSAIKLKASSTKSKKKSEPTATGIICISP